MTIAKQPVRPDWRGRITLTFHFAALAAAVTLVVLISRDAIGGRSFVSDPHYLSRQLWICLVFLADIAVDIVMSRHRWRALLVNLPFIALCIPYLNILHAVGIEPQGVWVFVMRFVPLVRAAAVFAIVTGWASAGRMDRLLRAYIVLLLTVLYFASLVFFVQEQGINPTLSSYGMSLWWAVMNMTTAGCYITAITPLGQALQVVLAAVGLILFPVFTVYVTSALSHGQTAKS